jgi:arylamine N-acetyltransferase
MNSNHSMSIQLKSHFLRLYQMALTDDQFDVLELQMLYHFADERGIPKEELDKLFLNPINTELSIPENLDTRIEYLYDFARIIWADEKVTDDELNMLKKYCRKFNFLDENINELTGYLIDCVKKGISKEEIINQLNS